MRTLVCTLKFRDGATVRVSAASESADLEVPVTYGGAVDRLTHHYRESDLGFLEWWLGKMARKLGAEIELKTEGEYSRWAE